MPKIYIPVPDEITFYDPITKKPMEDEGATMSFEDLMHKVMDNPKWVDTWKLVKAGDAIMAAFEEAAEMDAPRVMVLAEEDFKHLKEAIENPKVLVMTMQGPKAQPGFGIVPRLARQLIPLCEPIMLATEKDPREAKPEQSKGPTEKVETAA